MSDQKNKSSRCPYCDHGKFNLAIKARRLLRYCGKCGRVSDPEHPQAKYRELWKIWQESWFPEY